METENHIVSLNEVFKPLKEEELDSDPTREYHDNFISGNYAIFIGVTALFLVMTLALLNFIKTNQNEVELAKDRVRIVNIDSLFREAEEDNADDSSSSSSF
jgi:hypothetical protein